MYVDYVGERRTAMKKNTAAVFMTAGLLCVLLSGCRTSGKPAGGTPEASPEPGISTELTHEPERERGSENKHGTEKGHGPGSGTEPVQEAVREPEAEEGLVSALPYQFAGKYGIIQSEYPIYELDAVIVSKMPQKEKTISLTSALHQKQELLVSMVLDDDSELQKIPAGGEPPADGLYHTLSDGSMVVSEKYQDELWKSGQGLFLTGPGIPEAGIKPLESGYYSYPAYIEAYGRRRYIIEARFELPSAPESGDNLSGYALQVLDFEKPLEFGLKRVPEYGTLEELAQQEQGSLDTHDGTSIISMGERVDEGILISWYVYNEDRERSVIIGYNPMRQEIDMPTISGNGKQYSIRELTANPYWDNLGHYRLSDIKQYGRRIRCLFGVPKEEQNGSFQIHIPGVTFLNRVESQPVTLTIPEDYEELNLDIPWEDGSVRILGITRMKEPQIQETEDVKGNLKTTERLAVYIDVKAVDEDKDLALRGLICQRKLRWSGWENERYDFDEKGNLSGFRVFYDEGDTEVTLKFHGAAFYWNQPYVMEIAGEN
jgi:hypothetical protein